MRVARDVSGQHTLHHRLRDASEECASLRESQLLLVRALGNGRDRVTGSRDRDFEAVEVVLPLQRRDAGCEPGYGRGVFILFV